MKSKFIIPILTVIMLLVALLVTASPVSADTPGTPGPAAELEIVAVADTASPVGLAVLGSELYAELITIAPAAPAAPVQSAAAPAQNPVWFTLGTILSTIAAACRRRLANLFFDLKNFSLSKFSGRTSEGVTKGGGPNKYILPAG